MAVVKTKDDECLHENLDSVFMLSDILDVVEGRSACPGDGGDKVSLAAIQQEKIITANLVMKAVILAVFW